MSMAYLAACRLVCVALALCPFVLCPRLQPLFRCLLRKQTPRSHRPHRAACFTKLINVPGQSESASVTVPNQLCPNNAAKLGRPTGAAVVAIY